MIFFDFDFLLIAVVFNIQSEANSTMRELSGARCTDARLYELRIKIDTRTTNACDRSHC